MKNPRKNIIWLILIIGLAVLWAKGSTLMGFNRQAQVLSYSDFLSNLQSGAIRSIKMERHRARGEMGVAGQPAQEFVVQLPQSDAAQAALISKLSEQKAERGTLEIEFPDTRMSETLQNLIIPFLGPVILLGVLWFIFMRQAQSTGNQAFTFGRSKAKRLGDNVPKVTFEDVAGVEEAKVELQEVVEFLKNPKKFQALGARIPKGVLLLGPPGCGKTLLARAVAGEAGVPFFHISGSDFVEMFVGVGASRVRDLFDTAKAQKPSLVFIDEIDAVGRQRGAGLGGGHDEREQTLNQLLVEMDGFDPNAGVILIAATNRPDVLDPALLRPGRFDRRVVVDNPDLVGRRKILDVHVKGKPLSDEVNLDVLARRTPGFTGADLANMINEAALKAARENKSQIFTDDFESAIDRVVAGPERKSRVINDKEKKIIAYHEVGHAIVQELLPNDHDVHKVTILPRGMALGITWGVPPEERYLTSRSNLTEHITSLLAGRVAEELVFEEIHTGAANDLDRATDLARQMVTDFGMSERLGPLKFGQRSGNPFLGRDLMEDRNYSEEVARTIDEEVRAIIDACYRRAKEMLSDRRELMDTIVEVLLERETLDRDEFLALMRGEPAPAPKAKLPPPAPTPPGDELPADSSTPQSAPPLRPRPEPA